MSAENPVLPADSVRLLYECAMCGWWLVSSVSPLIDGCCPVCESVHVEADVLADNHPSNNGVRTI